jgi:hypothetical protein
MILLTLAELGKLRKLALLTKSPKLALNLPKLDKLAVA